MRIYLQPGDVIKLHEDERIKFVDIRVSFSPTAAHTEEFNLVRPREDNPGAF